MRILFICLGNICRSPLAQGVLERKIEERGLDWQVDSAGTGYWHIGERADPRTIMIANQHGIDITNQRARQFKSKDLAEFDLLLTADESVHKEVMLTAKTDEHRDKIKTMVSYLPGSRFTEIPDPWFGGDDDFENIYQLLEEVCEAIMASMLRNHLEH